MKYVKFWLENSPRSYFMHREKHFYFKMLITFEPNVAQRSVASQNDQKSKVCLPEASNTYFYICIGACTRCLFFLAPHSSSQHSGGPEKLGDHCKFPMFFEETITIECFLGGLAIAINGFTMVFDVATIAFNGFRWFRTIGQTMRWFRWIVVV